MPRCPSCRSATENRDKIIKHLNKSNKIYKFQDYTTQYIAQSNIESPTSKLIKIFEDRTSTPRSREKQFIRDYCRLHLKDDKKEQEFYVDVTEFKSDGYQSANNKTEQNKNLDPLKDEIDDIDNVLDSGLDRALANFIKKSILVTIILKP